MSSTPDLTPAMILDALGQPAALSATPVMGGADTRIWRVALPEGDFALRLLRPSQQRIVLSERSAMEAARLEGLPAPGVRAAGEVHGQPVLLIDWLDGVPLQQAMYAEPWKTWRLSWAFGQMQAQLHQIPAPPELVRGDQDWIDWAAPDPALAILLRRHASGTSALIHLDYHPLNVLVQREEVAGVLDWTNADGGDPRADVARTGAILRFFPGNPAWPAQRNDYVRRLLFHGWRAGYQSLAGPLTSMAPFHAWAGTLMQRDLAPRVGRADLPWLTEAWLSQVRRWTDTWQRRAIQAR